MASTSCCDSGRCLEPLPRSRPRDARRRLRLPLALRPLRPLLHLALAAGACLATSAQAALAAGCEAGEPSLPAQTAAAAALSGRAAASAWIEIGNQHAAKGQAEPAEAAWQRALRAWPGDATLQLTVELNRLRATPDDERLPQLQALAARIQALPSGPLQARLWLNLAAQALDIGEADRDPGSERAPGPGDALAAQALQAGLRLARAAGDERLAAEAHEGLAELYERARRGDEALRLTEAGIAHARRVEAHELLMRLEGRAGRLTQALGQPELALAAYRRAVDHVQAVRAEIPIHYADGRSSFRVTLEPLYLGLTDQLLRRAARTPAAEGQALLRQARDTVELLKQSEMEDYLRDRCSFASPAAGPAERYRPPAGTAIYYPIILPDRLELLLETARGIERRSLPTEGSAFREKVQNYVGALRSGAVLRARSRELYRQLIAPLEPLLAEQGIHTLVAVPDGVLRLLPLASLHDGQQYLIERLAVATVPSLRLAAVRPREAAPMQVLLAGMSQPGPVTEKLTAAVVEQVLDPSGEQRQARSLEAAGGEAGRAPGGAGSASGSGILRLAGEARSAALREALALPGVKQEIENIARVLPSTVLLDKAFTLQALKDQLRGSRHSVVHIASHGLFGDSADTSFILTYDDVLTLDALQALLREDLGRSGGERRPIDLLILSACQTAEGDDRAPLGMAGTALKAGARAAMGTLWPVFDEAANEVMSGFYRRLVAGGGSRLEALRAAQLALLARPETSHPIHWAPFILIGDWQ